MALRKELRGLEKKINQTEGLALYQVLRNTPDIIDACIQEQKFSTKLFEEDLGLFRFLLFSGYLNEHYHLYTSIFREDEEWSAKDRKFFTTLKSRLTPEIDMPLDNPEQVCVRLKLSDFSEKHILNLDLFEHLLGNVDANPEHLNLVFECLREHYESDYGESFMLQYLQNKQRSSRIFDELISRWNNYFDVCLCSNNADIEIAKLLDCVSFSTIEEAEGIGLFQGHIEESIATIYVNDAVPTPNRSSYELLKALQVKITDLESVSGNIDLVKFITEECLYQINLKNVLSILDREGVSSEQANSSTLTKLKDSNYRPLITYVCDNEAEYIEQVMFRNPLNILESERTVKFLVASNNLSTKQLEKVISQQEFIFSSLAEIPESLWIQTLKANKLVPTWEAILKCFKSEIVVNEDIDCYLDSDTVSSKVTATKYNLEKTDSSEIEFRRYILINSTINDQSYIQLNKSIGTIWKNFPSSVSDAKKLLLVENNLIALNKESYQVAESTRNLHVALISSNYAHFMKNILDYQGTISLDVALKLFELDLPNEFKTQLCKIIDDNTLSMSSSLCGLAAPYFLKLGLSNTDKNVAETLIHFLPNEGLGLNLFGDYYDQYGADQSLHLLTQKLSILEDEPQDEERIWKEKTVMEALKIFQVPISTISKYGKKPLLPFTEQNQALLSVLKENKIISSFKPEANSLRVFTKKINIT
jgi:hypothetical protein